MSDDTIKRSDAIAEIRIDNFYAQRWTKDDDYCSYGEREGE